MNATTWRDPTTTGSSFPPRASRCASGPPAVVAPPMSWSVLTERPSTVRPGAGRGRHSRSETVGALTRLDNRARALPGYVTELQPGRASLDDRHAARPGDRCPGPCLITRSSRTAARPSRRSVPAHRALQRGPGGADGGSDHSGGGPRSPAGAAVAPAANLLSRPAAGRIGEVPPTCVTTTPGEASAGDSGRITTPGRTTAPSDRL